MKPRPARCLRCGYEYELPRRSRSVVQARVCPACSYAGWEPAAPLAKGRPRVLLSGATYRSRSARVRSL